MSDAEVIVVGAGPAGAALAAWLGDRGRRVLLIDRARFPRDKVCGEAISPGAIAHLRALGLERALHAAGAAPYHGVRLVAPGGRAVEARYPDGATGYTLSRVALDALLLERAAATPGVTVREGVTVTGLRRETGAIAGVTLADGSELSAPLVVAADGRYSPVRKLAFGPEQAPAARRYCFVNTFEGATGRDDMLECGLVASGLQYLRVYQGDGRYSVCVVVDEATRQAHEPGKAAGFLALIETLPRVRERVAGASLVGPMKGMPLAPYAPARLVGDGVLLLGDAIGFMDPITGEGMYRAFAGAERAAAAIDAALDGESPVAASRLVGYEAGMRAAFDPVYRFVQLAVRLTTLPPAGAEALVATLGALPAMATAFAAVQGAVAPAGTLWRPWRWPLSHPVSTVSESETHP